MINVIIPVVDKPQVYLPILNEIAGRKDCRLYIGALEKFKDVSFPKNAEVKFYKADKKKRRNFKLSSRNRERERTGDNN